jgi:hypothetical protein
MNINNSIRNVSATKTAKCGKPRSSRSTWVPGRSCFADAIKEEIPRFDFETGRPGFISVGLILSDYTAVAFDSVFIDGSLRTFCMAFENAVSRLQYYENLYSQNPERVLLGFVSISTGSVEDSSI